MLIACRLLLFISLGASAEDVGVDAVQSLLKELSHAGCVDEHLQDQLILFMALANGESRVRTGEVTLHTKTAIYIAETLAGVKFSVSREENCNIISCKGLGFVTG